ncbi:hypothetical protein SDC9_86713 [bioreactor metagenome]|uniref:Uncharacterized protein n=1 Tax=bioreactor metagenome TaxID=1076179 RepID=A0A644ZGQ8_9ZZZZ
MIAQASENDYYEILLDNIPVGILIAQLLYDDQGEPINYLLLDINSVYVKFAGFTRAEILGKKATDLLPDIEPEWFSKYAEIIKTGKADRFEMFSKSHGYWFDVIAIPFGFEDKFAILYTDITKRKKIEEELRKSEERQAFLLKLSDMLRPLSDPAQIHAAVTNAAMDYFKTDRCYYCEIEADKATIRREAHRSNLPSVANVYSVLPIQKTYSESGQPFVIHDV